MLNRLQGGPQVNSQTKILEHTIERCRERDIIIPTYEEMAHPEKISTQIKEELKDVGLWDLNPRNLFRLSWKNEPIEFGGGFGDVNFIEFPSRVAQSRGDIRPPCRKTHPGGVRSHQSEGSMAVHRQLLPGRSFQLPSARLPVYCRPAGRDVEREIRMA